MGARPTKRMAGGTTNDAKGAAPSTSKRKRANMSRKEVMKFASAKKRSRNVVKQAKFMVAEAKKRVTAVKAKNKKVKRVLTREMQLSVSTGISEAIEKLGGTVTPVTIFAAATSALLRDGSGGAQETKSKAPYLLNAVGAAIRQLSPNLLVSKLSLITQVASRVINEFAASDHTAAAKAFRLIGDVAIRMITAPAVHALEGAARAARNNDETRGRAAIDAYLATVKPLVGRALSAVRSLEPQKINETLMPLFASTLRRVLLHAFTLDDHHKVLFGVFGRAEDDMDDDDAWDDIDSDDGEKGGAASSAPAPLIAAPELAGEVLWGLRQALLPHVPEALRILLPALSETSSKVSKAVLDNLSEIVTVTSGRCVAEFAGFVLREDGCVEEAQAQMLSAVLEPIAAQIVEAFRASADGDSYWISLATLIQRFYGSSKFSIFKRSAHAPAALVLAGTLGVPPQLHRLVKDPSGSAVQAGAFSPAQHEAFVRTDDAAAVHFQKALPSIFDLVPSTALLARLLDKMRVTDRTELNKPLEQALIAIGSTSSFAAFTAVLPWNPYAPDAPSSERARWSRSYLLYSVWRHVAHHDSLRVVADEILPCISAAQAAMLQCRSEERMPEAHQHQQMHEQYWKLVTGFFHYPVDFDEVAFRNIARALVGTLQPDPTTNALTTASHACCAAIHVLCHDYYALAAARDTFDDEEDDEADEEGEEEDASREDNFGDLLLERDDDVLHPHRHHFIPAGHALRVCALISKYSKHIMPRLCNTAELLEDANGTPILLAISSFSKVCAPATMESILKGIFDVGENIAAGVASAGSTAGGAMSVQRRVILDIAVGIIPQLDERFIEAVAGIAQASITATPSSTTGNTAIGVLQKKGYRILFQLFEYRLPDLAPGLAQVIGALQAAAATTLPAARKLRLKCLMWALDACKLYSTDQLVDFGLGFVDEVTMSTRERSQQSRQLAMDWFEKFYGFCVSAGVTADGQPATRVLFYRVLATLAGKTPMAVAAGILVAGKLLWCALRTTQPLPIDATRVSGMIFGLVDHAAAEVRNSAVIFARMVIKVMSHNAPLRTAVTGAPADDADTIARDSPMAALLRGVAVTVSQAHVASATRTQMRQLLERILDYFPVASVDAVFPSGSAKFLQYVDKQRRRATRLKDRDASKTEERRLVAELSKEHRGGEIREDGDDLDLLGESTIAQLATGAAKPKKRRTTTFLDEEDAADAEDPYVLRISGEGKMQIVSTAQGAALQEEERRQATADRLMRQAAGSGRGKRGAVTGPTIAAGEVNDDGKRLRTAETEDFENEELFRAHGGPMAGSAAAAAAAGVKPSAGTMKQKEGQQTRRAAKVARAESDIKRGDEFAANRAQGDVKKGTVEPFAYVPLSRAMLNKRNTSQRVKRFASIEHKALKGQKAQRAAADLRNAKQGTA